MQAHAHAHTLTHTHTPLLTPTVKLAVCGTPQLSTMPHFTRLAWWRAGSEFLAHLARGIWLSVGFCLISYPASAGHVVESLRFRFDYSKRHLEH